jgi:hypothetical protein
MSMTIEPRYHDVERHIGESRDERPTEFIVFGVGDDDDDSDIRTFVEANTDDSFTDGDQILYRGAMVLKPIRQPTEAGDDGIWEVSLDYNAPASTDISEGGGTQQNYSFDIGGGTQHIKTAPLVSKYPSGATDLKDALNYDGKSAQGVEITIPKFEFTISKEHWISDIDDSFKANIAAVCGCYNSGTFKGYSAGEVLFLGASASKSGSKRALVGYKFAVSNNLSGVTIGDITGIAKKGWEYLWVAFDVNGKPKAVYIHKIYEPASFSALGL